MKPFTWKLIATRLGAFPLGTRLRIAPHRVEHPQDGGLRPTVSLPVGQRADYRMEIDSTRALHVQDFGTYLEAHLEKPVTLTDLQVKDSGDTIATGAALGGLVGLALGRSMGAALAGILAGALLSSAVQDSDRPLSESGEASGTKEVVRINLTS